MLDDLKRQADMVRTHDSLPTSMVIERDMLWMFNIKFTEVETKTTYGSVSKR